MTGAPDGPAGAEPEERHPTEVEYADVPYRDSHTGADKAAAYDRDFWTFGTIKALDWSVERALLQRAMTSVLPVQPGRALDFACGTGRVLAELESYAADTTGVDISADMLALARERCTRSQLVETDVTAPGAPDVGSFDVITAFRFFLNAEPGLRRTVLAWMREHLESDGRLIANFHLNPHSLRGLYLRARWRGKRLMPMMSAGDVVRFLADGGFTVEDLQGYEYLPFRREGDALAMPRARQRVEDALFARPYLRGGAGCFFVVARPS